MKEKLKKFKLSKSHIMTIVLAAVVSIIFSMGTSYATNNYLYNSSDVSYDNTVSGITATDVQGAVDELYFHATDYSSINTRVTSLETNFLDKTYPVGSIYIGVNNTNPSTLFGGTWESFGEGRTLIGVGTGTDSNSTQKVFASKETGGEYNHTLTINEMPSHSHNQATLWSTAPSTYTGALPSNWRMQMVNSNSGGDGNWTMFNAGGSQSHNNIQPYITVYMWKRTA